MEVAVTTPNNQAPGSAPVSGRAGSHCAEASCKGGSHFLFLISRLWSFLGSWLRAPDSLLPILALYFLLQLISRSLTSNSFDLDEAEQIMLGQTWSWGYGPAGPLYQWLQIPLLTLFGPTPFALALLKNLLLFATVWFTYQTARHLTQSTTCATVAGLSLFFLPKFAWESQRDLTHSVLAATLAVATLYTLVRLLQTRQTRWFFWLGLCGAAGILSKYNYAFLYLGLLVAAAIHPETRPALARPAAALLLLIPLVLVAPNAIWAARHPDLLLLTAAKLKAGAAPGFLSAFARGLIAVLGDIGAFLAPLAALYLLLFWRRPVVQPETPGELGLRLLNRTWIIIAVLLLGMLLLTRTTEFKERWFQPILILAPVHALLLARERISPGRLRAVAGFAALIALIVLILLPGRLLLAQAMNREEVLTRPYATLARELHDLAPPGALVVTDTALLAGNLAAHIPHARTTEYLRASLLREQQQYCLIIWDATKRPEMPPGLAEWVQRHTSPATDTTPPVPVSPSRITSATAGASTRARRQAQAQAQAQARSQALQNARDQLSPEMYVTATYLYHNAKQRRLGLLPLRKLNP